MLFLFTLVYTSCLFSISSSGFAVDPSTETGGKHIVSNKEGTEPEEGRTSYIENNNYNSNNSNSISISKKSNNIIGKFNYSVYVDSNVHVQIFQSVAAEQWSKQ